MQESALAPRDKQRGAAPVQRLAAAEEAHTPAAAPEGTIEAPTSTSDAAAPGLLAARLESWRPALMKATDPVAFMTEASYNKAMKAGKDDARGFYVLAIAELDRLAAEMAAFSAGEAAQQPDESAEVERLGALAGAWASLYATIRDTGDNPADRDGLTAIALGAVRGAQSQLDALSGGIIGVPAIARMNQSLDDIRTFVGSWSLLAESDCGASKAMWASFLQTSERYRMILAEYGALEERGGDAGGTGKMAVKGENGMAKTRAEADQAADGSGGYMVLAMQTYSYKAANEALYDKQLTAIAERVLAGEFESLDQALRTGRQVVGGGRASETYYQLVDELVSAAWKVFESEGQITEVHLATGRARELLEEQKRADAKSEKMLDRSKDAYGTHGEHTDKGMLEASEEAWQQTQHYRERAEEHQRKAESLAKGVNAKLDEASQAYVAAHANIQSAKNHLAFVEAKRRPEFANAIALVEQQLVKVEADLGASQERLAEARSLRDELVLRAEAQRQALDQYAPEQMEVKIPEGVAAGDGEIKGFARGKMSLDAKINAFLSINGSTELEGGVKKKKGAQWGYLKNDWSLGATLNFVIVEISAAYVAGSKVEAKDKLTPLEVLDAGEDERAHYMAKREVYESGAKGKLDAAFESGRKSHAAITARIVQAAEEVRDNPLARASYYATIDAEAKEAETAQSGLVAGVVGAFSRVPNTSLLAAVVQGSALTPPQEVKEAVLELKDASSKSAAQVARGRGDLLLAANEKASQATEAPMAALAKHTNNPDVTFEDYGGWEVGAKVKAGGFDAGIKLKRITITTDGDEAEYNYQDKTKWVVSGSFGTREFKGDVSGEVQDGKLKGLSMSATLRYEAAFDDKKRKTLQQKGTEFKPKLAELIAAIKDPETLADKLSKLFSDFLADTRDLLLNVEKPDHEYGLSTSATPYLMIGFDLKFGDGVDVSMRLGAGTQYQEKTQLGAFKVTTELTTGVESSTALGTIGG